MTTAVATGADDDDLDSDALEGSDADGDDGGADEGDGSGEAESGSWLGEEGADAGGSSSSTGGEYADAGDESNTTEDPDTSSTGNTSGGETSGTSGSSSSSETTASTQDDDGTPISEPGCPRPTPEDWLFCEDFETIGDLRDVFFEYQDGGGAFVLTADQAASGYRSLRATYVEGREDAGWFSIAIGQTPEAFAARPHAAPEMVFDELYWRFMVRMEDGWPDIGPGKLTNVMSLSDSDFGHALTGSIGSDGNDVVLRGEGSSCVYDGELPCRGLEGSQAHPLPSFRGEAELFSSDLSGRWHCVEVHVRLNEVGATDGMFELWVDDQPDRGLTEIDWRGSWDDFGLNLVTIENFWRGGATGTLSRWIDDVVVARERIGCPVP